LTADLSRLLNVLALVALDTVLVLAFADQVWFRDLPCPICILQRAGFVAAGFGLALNLMFGPRPSHYGLAILGALIGGAISADQVLHYVVPGSGSYGNTIFGLHLYTWAFIAFAAVVVGCGVMLLFDPQFESALPPSPMTLLPLSAVALLTLLAVSNVASTLAICGVGLCPEAPSGYLIFHENLGLARLESP